jgi:hypothetical protein
MSLYIASLETHQVMGEKIQIKICAIKLEPTTEHLFSSYKFCDDIVPL